MSEVGFLSFLLCSSSTPSLPSIEVSSLVFKSVFHAPLLFSVTLTCISCTCRWSLCFIFFLSCTLCIPCLSHRFCRLYHGQKISLCVCWCPSLPSIFLVFRPSYSFPSLLSFVWKGFLSWTPSGFIARSTHERTWCDSIVACNFSVFL